MSDSKTSMTRVQLSRRTPTSGATTPVMVCSQPTLNPAVQPDPILEFYQDWERLRAYVTELCHHCQALEHALLEDALTEMKHCDVNSDTNEDARATRTISDIRAGASASFVHWHSSFNAEPISLALHALSWHDLESLRSQEANGWTELQAAANAVFDTPAQSLTGVGLKLEIILTMCATGPGDTEFPVPQLRVALADLQRICNPSQNDDQSASSEHTSV